MPPWRRKKTFRASAASKPPRSQGQRGRKQEPQECYLCLGNSFVQEHLIVDIGTSMYMTVVKGPLTPSTAESGDVSNVPSHYLLAPIDHTSTLSSLSDPTTTKNEVHAYRKALGRMMGQRLTITFNLSRSTIPHVLWQVISPEVMNEAGGRKHTVDDVEEAFRGAAEQLGFTATFGELPENAEGFTAWITSPSNKPPADEPKQTDGNAVSNDSNSNPSKDEESTISEHGEAAEVTEKILSVKLDDGDAFPVQFGRQILSVLLSCPKRERWQNCVETEERERTGRDAARSAFDQFRPTGF